METSADSAALWNGREVKVTLCGREVALPRLGRKDRAAWRRELMARIEELTPQLSSFLDGLDIDLEHLALDGELLQRLVRLLGPAALEALEAAGDLLVRYAPEHEALIDEASEDEILAAFVEVAQTAIPFEASATLIRRLGGGIPTTDAS